MAISVSISTPVTDWYSTSWGKRVKITVNSSQVADNLSSFPLYVDLSTLPSAFFDDVKADGSDIRITTTNGMTELPREVVDIDTGAETGEVWFLANIISSSTDVDFYIYYDNPSATEPAVDSAYGREAVWADYNMVHHFEGNASDATTNDADGTVSGAVQATGKIGNAYDFDGVDDYIEMADQAVLRMTVGGSISAWINASSSGEGGFGRIIDKSTSTVATNGYSFYPSSAGPYQLNCQIDGEAGTDDSTSVLSLDTWYHVVVTITGGGKKFYVNGVDRTEDGDGVALPPNVAGVVRIGNRAGATDRTFDGLIDEIRLTNSELTEEWALTEYNNQNSASTFYSVTATPESQPPYIDRTEQIVFNTLKKTDNLNQQVDNLSFKMRKYGTYTYSPEIGEEIVVTSGDETIFGGVIVRVTENVVAKTLIEYDVECNDYSQYLKRLLVTERYEEMSADDIIADIITNYASDFTVVNVVAPVSIKSISFNRLTIAESLQKLADALSYVWYVDYDKDIHFFAKNTEEAPFDLTDTSGNYIYHSLEIIEDITQLKNRVLVQGGEQTSENTRTEVYQGNAVRDTFPLANKFASLPTVLVNAVAQTVGVEYLDDDGSFDCMWNYNEKYIRFTAGNIPPNAQDVSIEGYYLFPIVVRVPSPASIGEFGYYEFAITDKSIVTQQEAMDRAQAELTSYQNKLHEGTFRTYENGLRSGQVININSTLRNKNVDVLIQSVRMAMRDPEGLYFEYEIDFATLKSVGIIEYLQRQLRDKEVIIDDDEILLNDQSGSDTLTMTDSLDTPVFTTGPYVWSNDAGTTPNKGIWGFSTYS